MLILADNLACSSNSEVAVVMHQEDKAIDDQAVAAQNMAIDDGRN